MGVLIVAVPIIDSGGHVFGAMALLLVLRQACWIVLRRGRSALGSSMMTERMVAFEVVGLVMVRSRLAPLPWSPAFACVLALRCGANCRLLQPATLKGLDGVVLVPWVSVIVAVICWVLQVVGLRMKSGWLRVMFSVRRRRGRPAMICGSGSVGLVGASV